MHGRIARILAAAASAGWRGVLLDEHRPQRAKRTCRRGATIDVNRLGNEPRAKALFKCVVDVTDRAPVKDRVGAANTDDGGVGEHRYHPPGQRRQHDLDVEGRRELLTDARDQTEARPRLLRAPIQRRVLDRTSASLRDRLRELHVIGRVAMRPRHECEHTADLVGRAHRRADQRPRFLRGHARRQRRPRLVGAGCVDERAVQQRARPHDLGDGRWSFDLRLRRASHA